MVLLSVGQHLSLWPAIKTLSPDREKLQSELHQIQSDAMSEFKVNFEWQEKHDL